jgi:hypothetical protein
MRCSRHPHLSSSTRPSAPVRFLVSLRFYIHSHRTIPGLFNTDFIGPPLQIAVSDQPLNEPLQHQYLEPLWFVFWVFNCLILDSTPSTPESSTTPVLLRVMQHKVFLFSFYLLSFLLIFSIISTTMCTSLFYFHIASISTVSMHAQLFLQ